MTTLDMSCALAETDAAGELNHWRLTSQMRKNG